MKIVHLELPRYFTLTVKEFRTDLESSLHAAGHDYLQFDTNPNFWRWLLQLSTPRSPADLFPRLLAAGGATGLRSSQTRVREVDSQTSEEVSPGSSDANWPTLAELQSHLSDLSRYHGIPLSLRGIQLPPAVAHSSYAMCSLVADNCGATLFSNFFHHLDSRLTSIQNASVRDATVRERSPAERSLLQDAQLITLGIDSPEGVFWALQFAAWLKSAGSTAHISIASHGWENFSLIHHIEALAKNPWFFGIINSVILYPESLPETLPQLAAYLQGGAPHESLHNIAIKLPDSVRIFPPQPDSRTQLRIASPKYEIPDYYFPSMDVPREHIVYAMSLVRNKCFYKKCTFCVQIAKHISDTAYSQEAEVTRALAACAELKNHNISMVNFMDEAMRPVDLQAFCTSLQSRGINLHWVGRMIAAAHYSPELLRLMRVTGCVEILFGLETFDPTLSADMGKISRLHEGPTHTESMVQSFLDAGLHVILSMIYEFPTETPAARAQSIASVDRLCALSPRVSCIFNRFALFYPSHIYQDPAPFNISRIEPRLPENDLQYHFAYECPSPQPPATTDQLVTMHRLALGLSPDRYATLLQSPGKPLLDLAHWLDYVSLGLKRRATTPSSEYSL